MEAAATLSRVSQRRDRRRPNLPRDLRPRRTFFAATSASERSYGFWKQQVPHQGHPGAQTRHGSAFEAMSRPGWQHTIFAPTDEAFAALGEETRESLLDEMNAIALFGAAPFPRSFHRRRWKRAW